MEYHPVFYPLQTMLFEDDFKLLYNSLQLLDMTRKRDRKVTKAFVSILVEANQFEEVFTKFFRKELETATLNTGILRGSTPCSHLLTEYLHLHTSYLLELFYGSMLKTIRKDKCLELNASVDSQFIPKRAKKLLESSQAIFDYIFSNPLPNTINAICTIIYKSLVEYNIPIPETYNKVNTVERFAVANTVFLHFICPFFSNPSLVDFEISNLKHAKRTMVMTARLFQALANDTLIESPGIVTCSSFIIVNRDKFSQFSADVVSGANGSPFYLDQSETVVTNSWIVLYKFFKGNKKRIANIAGEAVVEKLGKVIDIVTELRKSPPPKVIRSQSSAVSLNGFTPTPLSSIRRTASSDRRKSGSFNTQQILSASQPLSSSTGGVHQTKPRTTTRLYNM